MNMNAINSSVFTNKTNNTNNNSNNGIDSSDTKNIGTSCEKNIVMLLAWIYPLSKLLVHLFI